MLRVGKTANKLCVEARQANKCFKKEGEGEKKTMGQVRERVGRRCTCQWEGFEIVRGEMSREHDVSSQPSHHPPMPYPPPCLEVEGFTNQRVGIW